MMASPAALARTREGRKAPDTFPDLGFSAKVKKARMRRFFIGLWTFTALANLLFLAAAYRVLVWLHVPFAAAIALAAAVALVALFGFRLRLMTHDRPVSALRRTFELLYFTHWCAALGGSVLYLAYGVCLVIVALVAGLAGTTTLPDLHGIPEVASYAAGLALGTYGVWIRARWVKVRSIDVPVRGLDPALDGYKIAQLSDLHIGSLCSRRRAERWVKIANAQKPDLIALTGDYVTNGVLFHEDIAAALGGLRARDAVIATLGNHDYFGLGEPLISLLPRSGILLLRNARHTVSRDGAALEIAGIDDTWTRNADVEKALRGFEGGRPLIVLAHDPSLFPDCARHGAALVLSGHTHWGQVGVPFASARWNLARRVFRFSAGLYRDGDTTLYVNPGLGTTGPPIRLGSAPEITLLVLRAA
jgi:predicted MPP superfamily phosphohydrolase